MRVIKINSEVEIRGINPQDKKKRSNFIIIKFEAIPFRPTSCARTLRWWWQFFLDLWVCRQLSDILHGLWGQFICFSVLHSKRETLRAGNTFFHSERSLWGSYSTYFIVRLFCHKHYLSPFLFAFICLIHSTKNFAVVITSEISAVFPYSVVLSSPSHPFCRMKIDNKIYRK